MLDNIKFKKYCKSEFALNKKKFDDNDKKFIFMIDNLSQIKINYLTI